MCRSVMASDAERPPYIILHVHAVRCGWMRLDAVGTHVVVSIGVTCPAYGKAAPSIRALGAASFLDALWRVGRTTCGFRACYASFRVRGYRPFAVLAASRGRRSTGGIVGRGVIRGQLGGTAASWPPLSVPVAQVGFAAGAELGSEVALLEARGIEHLSRELILHRLEGQRFPNHDVIVIA